MKTIALIEKGKDGTYGIYTPDLGTTIIGEGKSVAEAKADFDNSLKEIREAYAEAGEELPEELKDIEFEYKYDIASVFNYFYFINVSKFAEWSGISATLMRQYKTQDVYISEARAKKIEEALHKIGHELISVSL